MNFDLLMMMQAWVVWVGGAGGQGGRNTFLHKMVILMEVRKREIGGRRAGGQAVSCNSNWWWCLIRIFEAVERNRYFHWQFCVISDPCV